MAGLSELVAQHTDLDSLDQAHLRRLARAWGVLADLCFADLLLFVPTRPFEGLDRFVIVDQIRPTTAQTLYQDDQVGRFVDQDERALVGEAFRSGRVVEREVELLVPGQVANVTAIPIRRDGSEQPGGIIGVLTTESPRLGSRPSGDLERTYLGVFQRFATMIVDGKFPYPDEGGRGEDWPRVGDGTMVLDRDGRVVYASPNAVSALHRVGYQANANGRSITDLGFGGDVVRTAFRLRVPVTEEVERGTAVTISARVLPLVKNDGVDGALVLLRDVSEIRVADRLIVSMDASIREIHHRVKNNLQTVSSLLRLQGRRLASAEAKAAIDESVRRIRSIALVHEILSREGGDQVIFSDVVQPIVEMVEQTLTSPERPVRVRLVGNGPTISAAKASSLAVITTELLQNAVEHGFPPGSAGGQIVVELLNSPDELAIRVHDDGVGLAPDFDLATSDGLGLTIVRTLASGELRATLSMRPSASGASGTVAELLVPLDAD